MMNCWKWLKSTLGKGREMSSNKYLIVGLGNIGAEYAGTRHNAGFMVVDALVGDRATFEPKRYGAVARMRLKNKELIVVKPSTLMNLSGNAVRYWMKEERIPLQNLLVVVDELALPFGELRLKGKGSNGGHNGLRHIETTIGTEAYARLRFGIGHHFARGNQVDYVLAPFTDEEQTELQARCEEGAKVVESFCLAGLERTMNQFNQTSSKRKRQEKAESDTVLSVKREATTAPSDNAPTK